MAEMPADYVRRYRPVKNWIWPGAPVHVKQYVSQDNPDTLGNRVLAQCGGFFRARAKTDALVFVDGKFLTIPHWGICRVHLWGDLKQPFIGKASPGELAVVARIFHFWFDSDRRGEIKSRYRPTRMLSSVQRLADTLWGVDCNSFVGSYLADNYPGHRWGPRVDLPNVSCLSTPFGKGGTQRKTLDEVRPRDVILYNHRHVSIIDAIDDRESDWIVCDVAEAKGKKAGGVQVNNREITVNRAGKFTLSRIRGQPEVIKCIVKPRGVPETP